MRQISEQGPLHVSTRWWAILENAGSRPTTHARATGPEAAAQLIPTGRHGVEPAEGREQVSVFAEEGESLPIECARLQAEAVVDALQVLHEPIRLGGDQLQHLQCLLHARVSGREAVLWEHVVQRREAQLLAGHQLLGSRRILAVLSEEVEELVLELGGIDSTGDVALQRQGVHERQLRRRRLEVRGTKASGTRRAARPCQRGACAREPIVVIPDTCALLVVRGTS
mmetsp:Transcript_86863/g.246333  ORF Transcript_86863/g.246333 Transcript_86863/m.246333 type:complete len:226 (-) Transcript_86863:105-782(-)